MTLLPGVELAPLPVVGDVAAEVVNSASASETPRTRQASHINDVVVTSAETRLVRESITEVSAPVISQTTTNASSNATPGLAIPLTATSDLPYDTPESSAFATFLQITRRRTHGWARMEVDSEAASEHDPRHITGAHVGIVMTVLVTMLQKNPSNDPRVTVLQRAAIAICLVSTILYFLQSRRALRRDPNGSFVERVVVYYPYLLLFACGVIYLISVALPSPRAMIFPFLLTLLAVLPMVLARYLSAPLMLTTSLLFPLGLVTFLILLPFLSSDWLA